MVLALAGRLRVEALVTEMMSIGPECLAAESKKIIRPELLVVTNVRLDHEEEMGRTKEAVAASLAAAVPPGEPCSFPSGNGIRFSTARPKGPRRESWPCPPSRTSIRRSISIFRTTSD